VVSANLQIAAIVNVHAGAKVVKTGRRLIKHVRCYWLLFAKECVTLAPVRKHAAAGDFAAASRVSVARR
jgi:hypothetical protein